MNSTDRQPAFEVRYWQAVLTLLIVLGIIYVAQAVSPLRIVVDAEALLSIADSLDRGEGLMDDGMPAVHSPGYPAIIAVLLKIGLARPWAFTLLNDLLLALGIYCSYRLFQLHFGFSRLLSGALCAACLLSFVMVKHSVLALTDIPFFGLGVACLLFLTLALKSDTHRVAYLWAALAMLLIGTIIRAIGLALLPAVVWTLVRYAVSLSAARRRSQLALVLAMAVIAIGGVFFETTFFSRYYEAAERHTTRMRFDHILSYRFLELGELALNTPSQKIPIGILPYYAAGVLLLIAIAIGLWLQIGRPRLNMRDLSIPSLLERFGPVDIFFLANFTILLAWAFMDTRFWIPVVPFVIGYAALFLRMLARHSTVGRWAVAAYAVFFALTGVGAIGYTTRISFSGNRFGDLYSGGSMRSTYCAALENCTVDPADDPIDKKAFFVLRRYR